MNLNDQFEVSENEIQDKLNRKNWYTCYTCGCLVNGAFLEIHNEWHEKHAYQHGYKFE